MEASSQAHINHTPVTLSPPVKYPRESFKSYLFGVMFVSVLCIGVVEVVSPRTIGSGG